MARPTIKFDEKRKKYVWRARLMVNGKQKERSGACKLKKNAETAANKAYNELLRLEKNQVTLAHDLTIKESILDWLQEYKHGTISPQSENAYRSHLKNHILPYLGTIKVTKLNYITYQKFINHLISIGLAKRTIKVINAIVVNYLDFMVHKMRLIDYNVASKVEINIKEDTTEDEKNMFYTDEEVKKILKCGRELSKKERNETCVDAFEVLLHTGLRISELLALQEEDYNSKTNTITINKQLSRIKLVTDPKFIPLKTPDSYREIAVDTKTAEIIKKRIIKNKKNRLRLPPSVIKGHFLFSKNGAAITPDRLRYFLKQICQISGVRYHTRHSLHAFRHTHIKHLVEANVPLVTIKRRVGHSRTSDITQHYMHSDDKMVQLASEKYEQLISKKF